MKTQQLGGWLQPQGIKAWVRVAHEIAPRPQNRALYDALYAGYLRLYLGSKEVVHGLKAITAGHYG